MPSIHFKLAATLLALCAASTAGCDGSPSPAGPAPDPTPIDKGALDQIVTSKLVLMNSDGTGAVALGTGFSAGFWGGYSPSWSPDGSRLIFSTTRCGNDSELEYICFPSSGSAADSGGLVIMNPETGDVTRPPAGALGTYPAWSPTDDIVAFTREIDNGIRLHLFVMRLDGAEAQQLSTPSVAEISEISWSPDGQQIAFTCLAGRFGICIINKDGTGFRRLTNDARWDRDEWAPQWSPDGTKIAYHTRTDANHNLGIAVMAADGTGVTRLTDGMSPMWSRDGARLIFLNGGVFTMNADGTNITATASKYGVRRPQRH